MRRKDRVITDPAEMEAILKEAQVYRIALTDGRQPYLVPLCFGYEQGTLYIHSAPKGTKIDLLRVNPRVCFEVDICNGVVKGDRPCSWGMRYTSVIGFGRAEFISDPAGKQHGLNCIMRQYQGGIHDFSDTDLKNVEVIRVVIESMTGKKNE